MFTHNIGEILWAKVDGFPYWPSVVTNNCKDSSSEEIYVSLINCNYQTKLSSKKVKPFYQNFDKYYSNNDSKLTTACEIANNIKLKGINYLHTDKVWNNEINNAKIKSVYKSENSIEYSVDFNIVNTDPNTLFSKPFNAKEKNLNHKTNNDVSNNFQKQVCNYQDSLQKFHYEKPIQKKFSNDTISSDQTVSLPKDTLEKNQPKSLTCNDKEVLDPSEVSFVNDLEVRIRNLMVQFSKAVASSNAMSQDQVLYEIFRIVSNLENVEIKTEVLISSKICKYLQSFYVLLYNHKRKIPENLSKVLSLQRNQINIMKEKIISNFMLFDQKNFDGDNELNEILIKEQRRNIIESNQNKKTNKINYILDNFDVKIKFEDDETEVNDIVDQISSDSENETEEQPKHKNLDILQQNHELLNRPSKENNTRSDTIIPLNDNQKTLKENNPKLNTIIPTYDNQKTYHNIQEKSELQEISKSNPVKITPQTALHTPLPIISENLEDTNIVTNTSNQSVTKEYGIINNFNENVLVLQQFDIHNLDIDNNSVNNEPKSKIQSNNNIVEEIIKDQHLINNLKKEDSSSYSTNSQNTLGIDQKNDFRIKYEGMELPKKRKKTCRKIYTAFIEEFKLEKASARLVTLNVEYRIHCLINYEDEKYGLTIKKQLMHVKRSDDCASEIKKILTLSISDFKRYLTDRNIF